MSKPGCTGSISEAFGNGGPTFGSPWGIPTLNFRLQIFSKLFCVAGVELLKERRNIMEKTH